MRLTSNCPTCGKILEETGRVSLSDTDGLVFYKCGHAFAVDKDARKPLKLSAVDNSNKHAREYQQAGVDFIVESGFNCIIGDQMRLGKTPQALLALQTDYENRTPVLILVRGMNLQQWIKEYKVWTDTLPLGIYPLIGGKAFIPPGFSAYIMSMDTFSRDGTCKNCKHALQKHGSDDPGAHQNRRSTHADQCCVKGCECINPESAGDSMVDRLLAFGFKLVIVDEAHSFKNPSSNRSKALISFLHNISTQKINKTLMFSCAMCGEMWAEDITIEVNLKLTTQESLYHHRTKCPHCGAYIAQATQKLDTKARSACGIVMLTGTPILNRADEFFVPLNIVAPERFPSIQRFRSKWLEQDEKGKWSRVNHRLVDAFREEIKPFFLRREKEDVYTDLPPINRMFTVVTVEDERLKKAYNAVLDRLEGEMLDRPNLTFAQSIAEFTMLRRICGLAKVKFAADYAEGIMYDSDTAKLAIGLHHHDVRDNLMYELNKLNLHPIKLDGEDSAEKRHRIAHEYFIKAKERILVLGMKAVEVGMELVYINNAVVLERQWSPELETQFEFRFYNPDKEFLKAYGLKHYGNEDKLKNKSTNIEYLIAKGTLDEWWYDMGEGKRQLVGETVSTQQDIFNNPSTFKMLLEQTVGNRL